MLERSPNQRKRGLGSCWFSSPHIGSSFFKRQNFLSVRILLKPPDKFRTYVRRHSTVVECFSSIVRPKYPPTGNLLFRKRIRLRQWHQHTNWAYMQKGWEIKSIDIKALSVTETRCVCVCTCFAHRLWYCVQCACSRTHKSLWFQLTGTSGTVLARILPFS